VADVPSILSLTPPPETGSIDTHSGTRNLITLPPGSFLVGVILQSQTWNFGWEVIRITTLCYITSNGRMIKDLKRNGLSLIEVLCRDFS
jgi:hypothetical protein